MTPVTSRSIWRSRAGIKRVCHASDCCGAAGGGPARHSMSRVDRQHQVPVGGQLDRAGPGVRAVLHARLLAQHPAGPGPAVHRAARRHASGPRGRQRGPTELDRLAGLDAGRRRTQHTAVARELHLRAIGEAHRQPAVPLLVVGAGDRNAAAQRAQPHLEVDAAVPASDRKHSNPAVFLDDLDQRAAQRHAPEHARVDLRRAVGSVERRAARDLERQLVADPAIGHADTVDEDAAPRPVHAALVQVVDGRILGDDGARHGVQRMDVVDAPGFASVVRPGPVEKHRLTAGRDADAIVHDLRGDALRSHAGRRAGAPGEQRRRRPAARAGSRPLAGGANGWSCGGVSDTGAILRQANTKFPGTLGPRAHR